MATGHTIKERLLAAVPLEHRVALARSLETYDPEADDPTLNLLAELIERQAQTTEAMPKLIESNIARVIDQNLAAVRTINSPQTWRKLLLLRGVQWIVAPLFMAALFVCALLWGLNHLSGKHLRVIDGMTRDTATLTAFTDYMQAAIKLNERSVKASEAILAVANLLRVPDLTVKLQGNALKITAPDPDAIKTTDSKEGRTITIDLGRVLEVYTREEELEAAKKARGEAVKAIRGE